MNNRAGMAILITLAVITIVIAVTLEINRQVRAAVSSTNVARDRLMLSQAAAAGIHAAMALLIKDRMDNDWDGLHEDWASAEVLDDLSQSLSLQDVDLSVRISDELSKIQINALVNHPDSQTFNPAQQMLWDRFLRLLQLEETSDEEDSEPVAIINSLKDWLDYGDDEAITGLSGAESDYYESLEPPYACGNAPISELNEVLLIKGVTPEMYYGTAEIPGMAPFITVYSQYQQGPDRQGQSTFSGKININTASLPILTALLPSANATQAETIMDYRQTLVDTGAEQKLSDPFWYQDIPGFADVDIDPDLITTSSDVFRITAVAKQADMELAVNAVIHRELATEGKWRSKVLSWTVE